MFRSAFRMTQVFFWFGVIITGALMLMMSLLGPAGVAGNLFFVFGGLCLAPLFTIYLTLAYRSLAVHDAAWGILLDAYRDMRKELRYGDEADQRFADWLDKHADEIEKRLDEAMRDKRWTKGGAWRWV